MKTSIIFTIIFSLFSAFAFSQDSTTYQYSPTVIKKNSYKITYDRNSPLHLKDTTGTKSQKKYKINFAQKTPMYRPTRLGSSSPLYNTYRKNDNGAGAVTTNQNKSAATSSPVIEYPLKMDSTIKHKPL
ncbi:MAG: hypothetical protein ABIP35_17600 [Ginsengibacter sp.]